MMESSIITGKVSTTGTGPGTTIAKKLYVKIFPGNVWYRAPRPKKAKVLGGELIVRYSGREWPEKRNGSLIGDEGFLQGISMLLTEVNIVNNTDISYASEQHAIKETITLRTGTKLTQEILDRGWSHLDKYST